MDYNFAQFLKDSRKQCKAKEDFIVKIITEIEKTIERHANPKCFRDKKSFLKRLEEAKYAAITGHFKESDKYNEELMRLLDNLL